MLESVLSACSYCCWVCLTLLRADHVCSQRCRPEEVRDVFNAGVVSEWQFRDDGAAIVRSANLLCRLGGSVYRWRHAVPALAGRLAYPMLPWRRLLRRGMPSAGPAGGSNSPSASPQVRGTCVPASKVAICM